MNETTRTRPDPVSTKVLRRLSRRTVRYWCFRFATEIAGGDSAVDAPDGLRDHFEALRWFSGWRTFAVTWDVADHDHLDIMPLHRSLEAAWDEVIRAEAKDLPV
jgi:hypothetical protein